MKHITKNLALAATVILASCGGGDSNKIIEEATKLRADQFCNGPGGLDDYSQKLDYLNDQLVEQGVSEEDAHKAIDLFDKKIKESCPDKYPK